MKTLITQLKLGDLVKAKVVEPLSNSEFIVNFQGDLIRVANQTKVNFKANEEITLRVMAVNPLGFQLEIRKRSSSSINVSV